jgi:hypothetical protein
MTTFMTHRDTTNGDDYEIYEHGRFTRKNVISKSQEEYEDEDDEEPRSSLRLKSSTSLHRKIQPTKPINKQSQYSLFLFSSSSHQQKIYNQKRIPDRKKNKDRSHRALPPTGFCSPSIIYFLFFWQFAEYLVTCRSLFTSRFGHLTFQQDHGLVKFEGAMRIGVWRCCGLLNFFIEVFAFEDAASGVIDDGLICGNLVRYFRI